MTDRKFWACILAIIYIGMVVATFSLWFGAYLAKNLL